MIELEKITGPAYIVRIRESNKEGEPFSASGVIEFTEDPTIAWAKAFQGKFSRKQLRELLKAFRELGIKTIKARRIDKHTLPLAKENDQGEFTIDLNRLSDRVAEKPVEPRNQRRAAQTSTKSFQNLYGWLKS